jgi:hypothetical protein
MNLFKSERCMSYRDCLDTGDRPASNTEVHVSISNSPTEHSEDTAVHRNSRNTHRSLLRCMSQEPIKFSVYVSAKE